MSQTDIFLVRWGVLGRMSVPSAWISADILAGTGRISGEFVSDVLLPDWPGKKAEHKIQAIGSSSRAKAEAFSKKHIREDHPAQPALYDSYQQVYDDPDVDCVYVGTPHSLHKQNCLDAIHAGKNVLCEKPFTMNADEAREVFDAAQKKGVFVMEAMWTRFYPLIKSIQKILHEEKRIGTVIRLLCDYGLKIDFANLPPSSRFSDPALGACSLLDIGIYPLTWAIVVLEGLADNAQIQATQQYDSGVEMSSAWIMHNPNAKQTAILSSSHISPVMHSSVRIEGSNGYIVVHGPKPSAPKSFTIHYSDGEIEQHDFEKPGHGLYWEADAVAVDLKHGRAQNETMPWKETIRVMELMDEIRRQGEKNKI